MKRKDLVSGVTDKMIIEAMEKPMPLFLILVAAAFIPNGAKYVTQQTMKYSIIGTFKAVNAKDVKPARKMFETRKENRRIIRRIMNPVSFNNAVRSGYLESEQTLRASKKGIDPKKVHGDIGDAQGVYRITSKGLKRLEQYIAEFKKEESLIPKAAEKSTITKEIIFSELRREVNEAIERAEEALSTL